MSSVSDTTTSQRLHRPPAIRWTSWPIRDEPPQAILAASAAALAMLTAYAATDRAHLGLLAVGVVLASMWRSLLPSTFELSGEGVDHKVLGRIRRVPWAEIRRYERRGSGLLLLPHADRSALDAFAGLYLPWAGRRDEILAQVEYYLDRSASSSS
jgi:hypothetical protein